MHKVCLSCKKNRLHHGRGFCQQCYRAHMKTLKEEEKQKPSSNTSVSNASVESTSRPPAVTRLSVPARMETRSSPASKSREATPKVQPSKKQATTTPKVQPKAQTPKQNAGEKLEAKLESTKEEGSATSDDKSQATDELQMEVEEFLNDVPLLVNRLNIKCLSCHRSIESEVACKYSLVYCGNCYFIKTGTKRPRSIRPSIQISANPIQIAVNPIHIAKNTKSSRFNTPTPSIQNGIHTEAQNMEVEHTVQNGINEDVAENHQIENAQPQNAVELINLSSASENENH